MISLSHEITKKGQIIHTIIFKELKTYALSGNEGERNLRRMEMEM